MRRIALFAIVAGLFVSMLASAQAQATRTWISGVGDDANPCIRTAPCKTFAGAISKTVANGEINCLDPGGFGAVTITKSITLNCHQTIGSILVAGTNGVTIAAGASDRVILRDLQIQGVNQGLVGVKITSAGVVSIEDCVITQFAQQGIDDARTSGNTKLFIRNTFVSHNAAAGIAMPASGGNNVEIENSHSVNNAFGIAAGNGNRVMVKRSVISGNGTGVQADAGGQIAIDDSAISNNGTGFTASGIIRISNSDINFNTTAFAGTPTSYGNNRIFGNTATGTALGAAGGATPEVGQQ